MEQKEIQAHTVILEVTDETTGETFRRELPIDFYENANFLRLRGEDINGHPSELVFLSSTGTRRLKDLMGQGPTKTLAAPIFRYNRTIFKNFIS